MKQAHYKKYVYQDNIIGRRQGHSEKKLNILSLIFSGGEFYGRNK